MGAMPNEGIHGRKQGAAQPGPSQGSKGSKGSAARGTEADRLADGRPAVTRTARCRRPLGGHLISSVALSADGAQIQSAVMPLASCKPPGRIACEAEV